MNKSKFLKKSLAMLLALMLVLAMIPLSASAEGTQPTNVTVDNKAATHGDGDVYTAEAANVASVALSGTVGPDQSIVFYDKDGNPLSSTTAVNLTQDAEVDKEAGTYTLTAKVFEKDAEGTSDPAEVGSFTLVITQAETPENTVTTIDRVVGVANMVTYTIDNTYNTIDIVMDFGVRHPTTFSNAKNIFVPTSDDVTVKYSRGQLTVTADADDVRVYTVNYTNAPAFESFTVPEQVGESEIVADEITNTIDITVPFGYDFDSRIVPTFTLGDTIEKVTSSEVTSPSTAPEDVELESGETGLEFTTSGTPKTATKTLTVVRKDGAKVNVTLTLTEADNTASALETIQIADARNTTAYSEVVEVEGTEIDVELVSTITDANRKSVTVKGDASANSTISIPAQTGVKAATLKGDATTYTLNKVNITDESFIIRVTAADGTYTDYTINLTVAERPEATLNGFSVESTAGADKGTVYTATRDGNTYSLTLPFSAKKVESGDSASLDNYNIMAPKSTGASIKAGTTPIATGDKLSEISAFSATNIAPNQKNLTASLVVTNGAGASTSYTIKLTFEDPSNERAVISAEGTSENTVSKMNEDNTYPVSQGTLKDEATGENVRALRVKVPASFDKKDGTVDKKGNAYLSDLTLSDGAVAYYDNSGNLAAITTLDMDAYGVQGSATSLTIPTNALSGNVLDTTSTVTIYVVSEAYSLTIDAGDTISSLPDDSYTVYEMYAVADPAKTGHTLESIGRESLTMDLAKGSYAPTATMTLTSKVTQPVGDTHGKVVLSAPNSITKLDQMWSFFMDYKASSQADVYASWGNNPVNNRVQIAPTYADDGVVTGQKGTFICLAATPTTLSVHNGTTWQTVDHIVVVSEAGDETSVYDLEFDVADAEKGGEITALSVNGTAASIDGLDITADLPYGSDLVNATLDIPASKMAYVTVDGKAYDPDATYDLNGEVVIKVVSEDGLTVKTYTLTSIVDDSFSDVSESKWYFEEVMKAANLGWINGVGNGRFEPEGVMTRGDFALIVARVMRYDETQYPQSAFPDVPTDSYYSAAIAFCNEQGYLDGDNNGNFNPEAPITREEMAKIICNAAGVDQVTNPEKLYADDDTIAEWAKGYVYGCQAAEIMMGNEEANTFDARSNATRAEAAAVLVRAFA